MGLSVVLSLGSAGCSLFLSGPDPKRPLHTRPACSTNKGAVAVDGVVSGLLVAGGLSQVDSNNNAAAAIPIVLGVAYGVAAVYGNSTVNDCNEEVARFERSEQPQLADGPPGAPVAPSASAKARWSRDEMVKAVAAKKAIEAQEAAAQLGPPPMKQKVAPTAPPPSDPNGNADAATEPPPPAKPPPPKPSPPPQPTNRWDDFWKEQQP